MPKFDNIVRDPERGITINVNEYRELEPAELSRATAHFRMLTEITEFMLTAKPRARGVR
jgi:hypothetical protein